MIVEWAKRAEEALDEATAFVNETYGWESSFRFLDRVLHTAELLERHPHLGPPEPLLADRPFLYRSVVVGHLNKIVYRVLDDRIEIVDFWDTRREPKAQAGQVK